ncbi:unnamed protein product [Closterium sp. Yama58-4]|nr:unnamed protein product [Closterium sp. Yama58-4]
MKRLPFTLFLTHKWTRIVPSNIAIRLAKPKACYNPANSTMLSGFSGLVSRLEGSEETLKGSNSGEGDGGAGGGIQKGGLQRGGLQPAGGLGGERLLFKAPAERKSVLGLDALARAKRAAAGIPEKPPVTVAAARFAEEGEDEGEKAGGEGKAGGSGKWVADGVAGGGGKGDGEGGGGGSAGDKSGGGGSKERRRYRVARGDDTPTHVSTVTDLSGAPSHADRDTRADTAAGAREADEASRGAKRTRVEPADVANGAADRAGSASLVTNGGGGWVSVKKGG